MTSQISKPRSRKCRFSQEECSVLIAEYGKQKDVITTKFSDSVTLQKKHKAWDKVVLAVNSVNPKVTRTLQEVKKKWQDIKSSTKSKEGKRRKEMKKTGGGKAIYETLTVNEEEAIAVIGDTAIEGIAEGFDSNDVNIDDESEDINVTMTAPVETNEDEAGTCLQSTSSSSTTAFSSETTEFTKNPHKCKKKRDHHYMLDDEILQVEKERLEVEKKRLKIEQRRLYIEEKRLQLEVMKASNKIPNVWQRLGIPCENQSEFENNDNYDVDAPIYTSL